MQANQPKYWLYQWIDEYAIRTVGDCAKVARKKAAIDRLHELSAEAASIPIECIPRHSVVAGSRIDLSGELDCGDYDCVIPQIDYVFGRVWHYFDSVVVDDLDADEIVLPMGDKAYSIQDRVRLLLHLRKIGGEQHIIFVPKPRGYCPACFRRHAEAEDLSLSIDSEIEEEIVDRLTKESTVQIERREYGWHYSLRHPTLEEVLGAAAHHDSSHPPTREEVAREVFGRYCNALLSDVSTSRSYGLPLLQSAEAPWVNSQPSKSAKAEDLVALSIRLPMLGGIPAAELLKIRSHNWPSYVLLRDALRNAIQEQQARAGSQSPEEVAKAVVEENIEPELARMENHLKVVKRSLGKKVGAAAFVTGTASSVGPVSGVPLIVAAGIAAVGAATIPATIPEVFKYFDERDKVRESSWHLLWKLRVRSRH
jgi:hypothetical protein